MIFCKNCGASMQEQETFCTQCGTPRSEPAVHGETPQNAGMPGGAGMPQGAWSNPSAPTGYMIYPDQGVERPVLKNSYTAIIGYLGWIGFIIGMVAGDRKDAYARPHLNQSLVMNIACVIGAILYGIGGAIISVAAAFGYYSYYYGGGNVAGGVILVLIGLTILIFTFVCWIIGLVRACKGRTKPVFLFGKIRLLK